jgi:hypothetical protein
MRHATAKVMYSVHGIKNPFLTSPQYAWQQAESVGAKPYDYTLQASTEIKKLDYTDAMDKSPMD